MKLILAELKKIISNFKREVSSFKREYPEFKKVKLVHVLSTLFFFFAIYSIGIYNSSLKEKRIQEINDFLSNDQTVLLKNYILNQIKSPYLEYDYIVKENKLLQM